MVEKKVLIYSSSGSENDYRKVLGAKGFSFAVNKKWKEIYLSCLEEPPALVLVEILKDDNNSRKLLDKLLADINSPSVFILSEIITPDFIVSYMKRGVVDFMKLPVNRSELTNRIEKAYADHEIQKTLKNAEKEKIRNLENQLQWYSWEERARNRDKTSMRESLFHSLQLSFNRPAGIGALVTLTELLGSMSEKKGDKYIVDADIFEAAVENGKISQKTIDIFSGIDFIVDMELKMSLYSCEDIRDILQSIVDDAIPLAVYKKNTILVNEMENCSKIPSVYLEKDRFKSLMREVLINAMKFSKENSKILLITHLDDDNLNISVFNEPLIDEDGHEGVPTEFEDLVFEPFFRITKRVNEAYKTLEVGLGLTLVEKIIKKHNGKVKISNITDYSDLTRDPVKKVHLKISLPIV